MFRLLLFVFLSTLSLGLTAQVWFEEYPDLEGSRVNSLQEDNDNLLVGLSAPGLRNSLVRIDVNNGQFRSGFPPVLASCDFPGASRFVLDGPDQAVAIFDQRDVLRLGRFDFESQNCRIRDFGYLVDLPFAPALDTVVTDILIGQDINVYVAGYLVLDTDNTYSYFVHRYDRFTGDLLSLYLSEPVRPSAPPFTIPSPRLLLGLSNGDVLIQAPSTGVGGNATSDFVQRISADGEPKEVTAYGRGLTRLLDVVELSSGDYALLAFTDNGTSNFSELIWAGNNSNRQSYSGVQNFGDLRISDFRPTAMIEDADGDIVLAGRSLRFVSTGGRISGTALVKTSGANAIEDLIFIDDLFPRADPNELLQLANSDFIVSFGTATPSIARIEGFQATPTATVDLELDIIQQSANQFTFYTNNLLLSNTGTATAHNVVVSFPRPAGTVYQGGNEWTASEGTFDPYGAQQWRVDSIPAGETFGLTLNLFLLTEVPGVSYAQVLAQDEADLDSTPGNGTPPVANEDDEASTNTTPPGGGGGGGGGGTGTDIDLELNMSTASTTINNFSIFSIEIKVTNNSANDATGVSVFAPSASTVVYTGGNEFSASQGSFHPYGDQIWNVGDLPGGTSATLTINYFLLRDNPTQFYAEVFSANESDADSSPRNGGCCTPNEDDEAALTINGANAQPLLLSAEQLRKLRPATLSAIYPNVVEDYDVTLEVLAREAGTWSLQAFDMQGRVWDLGRLNLAQGHNSIDVPINNLPSGTYQLTIPIPGMRLISKPLIVTR